jgi:hypothetical protein
MPLQWTTVRDAGVNEKYKKSLPRLDNINQLASPLVRPISTYQKVAPLNKRIRMGQSENKQ